MDTSDDEKWEDFFGEFQHHIIRYQQSIMHLRRRRFFWGGSNSSLVMHTSHEVLTPTDQPTEI
jgi:hypothetical protein